MQLIKFIKLPTWWLPQTSGTHIRESWRFESMYTLQGKTRSTRRTLSMLSPRMVLDYMYLMRSTHNNLSWSHQQWWIQPLLPRKWTPDPIHNTIADRFAGSYPVSLPEVTIKVVGVKPPSVWAHILACNQYVQYLLVGPSHRSLTNTSGGYYLGGVSFPHHTPRPSQPAVSAFHLRAPPGLQLNKIPPLGPKFKIKNLWPPCGLSTTQPSTETYIYA
jgi:hypothetical protein